MLPKNSSPVRGRSNGLELSLSARREPRAKVHRVYRNYAIASETVVVMDMLKQKLSGVRIAQWLKQSAVLRKLAVRILLVAVRLIGCKEQLITCSVVAGQATGGRRNLFKAISIKGRMSIAPVSPIDVLHLPIFLPICPTPILVQSY